MANQWKAGNYKNSGMSKSGYMAKNQAGKSSGGGGGDGQSSQYSALMKKYNESLNPSKAENKATDALNKLTTSEEKGLSRAGSGSIPMGLITSQQKAITDNFNLQSAPLSRTIASEQAKRQAASDSLSAEGTMLANQQKSTDSTSSVAGAEQLAAFKNSLPKKASTAKVKLQTVNSILSSAGGWADAAAKAQAAGIDTSTNSAFDIAAKKKWNPDAVPAKTPKNKKTGSHF